MELELEEGARCQRKPEAGGLSFSFLWEGCGPRPSPELLPPLRDPRFLLTRESKARKAVPRGGARLM